MVPLGLLPDTLYLPEMSGVGAVLLVVDVLLLFFGTSLLPALLVDVLPDLQPIRQANTRANASTQLVSFIGAPQLILQATSAGYIASPELLVNDKSCVILVHHGYKKICFQREKENQQTAAQRTHRCGHRRHVH